VGICVDDRDIFLRNLADLLSGRSMQERYTMRGWGPFLTHPSLQRTLALLLEFIFFRQRKGDLYLDARM